MAEVRVRALARSDDRSGFACGDIELDRFFQRYAGQNQFRHHIGKLLLRFAFALTLELRERFGCVGVVVDAKAAAIPFYSKLGFRPLEPISGTLGDRPEPMPMFLAVRRIAAAAG